MILKIIIFSSIFAFIYPNPLPLKFPDSGTPENRSNTDQQEGRSYTPYNTRQTYSRPNGNFNRLPYSRITVNPYQNDNDYVDTDVKPDNVASITGSDTTNAPVAVDDNQQDILPSADDDDSQQDGEYGGGYYPVGNFGTRRRRRKRPCIPVYSGHGHFKNDDGSTRSDAEKERFFYDYTVINNHYDINAPVYPPYQQQSDYPTRPQKPIYNAYGGYTCIPNYGHGGHFGNRPHRPFRPHHHGGQGGGGGGGYNRPQGGGLGFFGPGGLFDFSNSESNEGTSPQGVLSDTVSDDDIKPVWEVNVPDTIQAVQNFKPGDYVGGIANAVNGFIQELSNRPNKVIRQINREVNSYLRPLYHIFR